MFPIHHDNPYNENTDPFNMPKQNMTHHKKKRKQVLTTVTNNQKNILITNKIIKNTARSMEKDAKLRKSKKSKQKIKKVRENKLNTKKENIYTNTKKNPVIQYAKKTNEIANIWEKEIDSIVSTAPVMKGKNLLCYVEVYSHYVKDEYFNSIKSNILSKYPQWKYIFEQKHSEMTYGVDSETNCKPSLVSNFRALSSTINYVQVYDDRCRKKYYNIVKSRMFLRYPSWKLVFDEGTYTQRKDKYIYLNKKHLSLQNYKKQFKEFWNDDNHDHHNGTKGDKKNNNKIITLHTNNQDDQNTCIDASTNVKFKYTTKNKKKVVHKSNSNWHMNNSMRSFQTNTLYIVAIFVLFFITPVHHESGIMSDGWLGNSLIKGESRVKHNESPNHKLLESNKIVQMEHSLLQHIPLTTQTPHTRVANKQAFVITGRNMEIDSKNSMSISLKKTYTNIAPIQIIPYPLSSNFFLKTNIIVETGDYNKDIIIDFKKDNTPLDINSENNDVFDIKIFKNTVQPVGLLKQKTIKKIINLSPISKTFKNIRTKVDKGNILDTQGNTKQNVYKKVTLKVSKNVKRPEHKKVTIAFSPNLSKVKFIQVNSMVTFQTSVKGFVEKYSKTCVFVENADTKKSGSARSCKSLDDNDSNLSKQIHVSEFKLKFHDAGVYRITALLLHPRNGKLSEVVLNEITIIGNGLLPAGTNVGGFVFLL
jgi:hypothetical protein